MTRLPGDPPRAAQIAAAIRVDQAGEYGAKRIYEGQLAVLGVNHPLYATIKAMADQEQPHLDRFNAMMTQRRIRPSALSPVWHVAGFALGAATALLGPKAAMACTDAVESVIAEHYAAQFEDLKDDEPELATTIAEFRADEVHHRETAQAHGAEQALGYPVLAAAIKVGCRLAIRAASQA
jgi:3-demethoxyubiquinol 3-hydroxylase